MKTVAQQVNSLVPIVCRAIIADQAKHNGVGVDGKAKVDRPSILAALAAVAAGFVDMAAHDLAERMRFEAFFDAEVLRAMHHNSELVERFGAPKAVRS